MLITQKIKTCQIYLSNIEDLLNLLGSLDEHTDITIDLAGLSFIDIAPLNILLAKLLFWKESGKNITLKKATSDVHQYMQRMNFFRLCGLNLEEKFSRHPSQNKFSVIKELGHGQSAALSTEVADVIAPDQSDEVDPDKTGFYDFMEYAVSELINNVLQHANGRGFISAQYYKKSDRVQVCIADIGIGVRASFIDSGFFSIKIQDEAV